MEIGAKLKILRQKNGLTMQELADRSEVTKGFVSQLERDLTSPNVATLADILEALGTNLNEFFQDEKENQIVFKKDDFFLNEQDDYLISYIVPNAQKNDMEPILLELFPNQKSMVIEPHEGQEFGYVLSGKIELVYGDKKEKINKGETFYINGNSSHYLENSSNNNAKVIWICNPPIF